MIVVTEPFHIGEQLVERGTHLVGDAEAEVRADPERLRRCVAVADRGIGHLEPESVIGQGADVADVAPVVGPSSNVVVEIAKYAPAEASAT